MAYSNRPGHRDGRGSSTRSYSRSSRRGSGSFMDDLRAGGGDVERKVARNTSRAYYILVFAAAIFAVFFIRLFYLQVIVAPEYSQQAEAARTVGFYVEPHRGTIYDRNGNILAISVDATTIYANPSEIDDPYSIAGAIASVLGGNAVDYVDSLTGNSRTFSFIARKADTDKAAQLKALNLKGIYFIDDTRREYPYGQVGGQVVGACNVEIDEDTGSEYYKGISGLELYYNEDLAGTAGYYEAEVGADGTPIPGGVHESTPAVNGQDIVVSLDIELQESLETQLTEGLANMGVKTGTAMVMDGGTGEIYAAASLPLFNPADRSEVPEGSTQLKCISNLLEPGSIFKTVSAMSILETNTMTPDTTIACPAVLTADGYQVSDAHERGDTVYSLRQIIQYSSNVGISLSTEKMGFDKLYDHILKYNLHTLTGVDYPGEQLGYLLDFDNWSKVAGYNISFGQGISVTPVQLVRFYGALVNDGVECTPHFLMRYAQTGEEPVYETQDVVENKDAIAPMQSMLQTVVEEGTGVKAAIDGYDVAGKTSTAEIYDEVNGGYRDGVYNLGFCGFIANSSSQLVCYVGADEVPSDGVVTPIFKAIMTSAIDRYNITPK